MTKPAQYLAQNSHLPLQALFRARLQHTKTLLCTQPPNDNFRPYDTLTCPRCYPQPNHYALHTHLPKDNIIHLILKCPTTSQPAQAATTKISNIMQDFGIEPPWNLTQPSPTTRSPPPHTLEPEKNPPAILDTSHAWHMRSTSHGMRAKTPIKDPPYCLP